MASLYTKTCGNLSSPADVWAVQSNTFVGTGTIGNRLASIKIIG